MVMTTPREADLTEAKRKFLEDEFAVSAIMSALRRSGTYASGATAKDKERFRSQFRNVLKELGQKYEKEVSEKQHERNLLELIQALETDNWSILAKECLRIGVAQKALNLYLKYLWCRAWIPVPPHCPFDRIIIQKMPCKDQAWTKMDKLEEYNTLVQTAREVANKTGFKNLAEWELVTYAKAVNETLERES